MLVSINIGLSIFSLPQESADGFEYSHSPSKNSTNKNIEYNSMSEVKTTISLPPGLAKQAQEQIQAGWFPDINSLVVEALRRYLETHRNELMERFIREDVEWGLHGNE